MNANTVLDAAIKAVPERTQEALARLLGIRSPSMSDWRKRNTIPKEHCPTIEALLKGSDDAYRCEQIRPDVVWTRDITGQVTGYHVPLKSAAA